MSAIDKLEHNRKMNKYLTDNGISDKIYLDFIKIENKWYLCGSQYGTLEEREMVAGADELLDKIHRVEGSSDYEGGDDNITFHIRTSSHKALENIELMKNMVELGYNILYKMYDVSGGEEGANYMCPTYKKDEVSQYLWLCNVTKVVFGEFPEVIYFRV